MMIQRPLLVASTVLLVAVGCEDQGAKKTTDTAETKTAMAAKPEKKAPAKAAPEAANAPAPGDIPAPEDVAAPPEDAAKTASGLASKVLKEGTGNKPTAEDTVEVHYTGWTTDGKMFDSSVKRGQPARFPLKGVIKGWTEGVQLMKVGEKRRFWIPQDLAYQGRKGPPEGMLVFDVELLSVVEVPKTPADVKAPPKNAKKTKSGLAYVHLKEGSGEQPTDKDTVEVHYTGWTTDGKMFDSSVARGRPAKFPLKGVIPGWTEGLQLMKVGGKTRFWIPEALAYKGERPPKGMLVFDVELLNVLK